MKRPSATRAGVQLVLKAVMASSRVKGTLPVLCVVQSIFTRLPARLVRGVLDGGRTVVVVVVVIVVVVVLSKEVVCSSSHAWQTRTQGSRNMNVDENFISAVRNDLKQ